jgi:hypothetical protein
MPKVKDKAGKAYTWHGQRSARYMKRDTCVQCHADWNEQQADYQIDAVQNYIRGKITAPSPGCHYRQVRRPTAGVPEDTLRRRASPRPGPIYWEWWIMENSDGFTIRHGARVADALHSVSQDASRRWTRRWPTSDRSSRLPWDRGLALADVSPGFASLLDALMLAFVLS